MTKFLSPLKNTYIFLRHGQTDYNLKRIFQGRIDIPLNEEGQKQAHQIALPVNINVVYSSPLRRAAETAEIVAKNHKLEHIIPDFRLVEKSGGVAEGKYLDDIQKEYANIWKKSIMDLDVDEILILTKYPEGESDYDVAMRLKELIEACERELEKQQILFVTHEDIIRAARYLFGMSKEEIYLGKPIHNCSVEIYTSYEPET
jgi:broad specificity phosphatase PhoE